jgi:hypothetical protein
MNSVVLTVSHAEIILIPTNSHHVCVTFCVWSNGVNQLTVGTKHTQEHYKSSCKESDLTKDLGGLVSNILILA